MKAELSGTSLACVYETANVFAQGAEAKAVAGANDGFVDST